MRGDLSFDDRDASAALLNKVAVRLARDIGYELAVTRSDGQE